MTKMNNTHVDNAESRNVAMSMYNLIQYSDNYSKISWSLRQYYREEPNAAIVNPESLKS